MKYFVPILSIFFIITSCSSSDNGDSPAPAPSGFDRGVMLTHWADDIIVPTYNNLVNANATMQTAIVDFTQNPSIDNLQTAREAHEAAYIAWQSAAFYEVGPAKNENLRLYFNNYPVNTTMTEQLALQDEYNLHLASNASRQGYPAIDYLLNGFAATDEAIIAKYTTDANATHYTSFLNAIAQRLVEKSTTVRDAWENGYRDSFVANDGSSASASVDLIANDFLLYYEKFFRNGKVRFPVGYNSGTAAPENVESYYNPTLSKTLLVAANTAMRNFFEGKGFENDNAGNSFKTYLNALNKEDISQQIIQNFNTINTTADNINGTFREAVVNDRVAMLNLHDRIQENVIPMKVDMMQALRISVAYFDGDGD